MEPTPTDAQSAQDVTVGYFFHLIYSYALDELPTVSLSKIQKGQHAIWATEGLLRKAGENLRSFGMEDNAQIVERIASDCEENAYWTEPDDDDPWVIGRYRGDMRLRTYAAWIANSSKELFGQQLYGTLATITNVVFERSDMTGSKIREMLRARPGRRQTDKKK
jgi:hypothetical protein